MKPNGWILLSVCAASIFSPDLCLAAGAAPNIGAVLPLWSMLPFAGILLSIALVPLVLPRFWHRHFPKVSAFWAIVFAVPFIYFFRETALYEIGHIMICLLYTSPSPRDS